MIREADAATKDLRTAGREAKNEMSTLARDEVAAQVQAEVSRQLAEPGMRTSEGGEAITRIDDRNVGSPKRIRDS